MPLDLEKSHFLDKIIPFGWLVQDLVIDKSREYKGIINPPGLHPLVFIPEVLYKTNWGEHPLAAATYKNKDANNLTLLTVNEFWEGPSIKYEGIEYKLFESYEEFCIHYTDLLVMSDYDELLEEKDYLRQIELLTREDSKCYNGIINILPLLGYSNGKK